MKKIKVLHISETFAAGVYTYIKDICGFFENNLMYETYVIYSGKREDTNREKFKNDFSEQVNLIEIEMEREISPFKDFKSLRLISKKIKQIQPNIIHLHSTKAGVIGRIASKFCPKAKVYYTPNGYSFIRQDISNLKQFIFKTIEISINKIFGGTTIACGDTEYELAKKIGNALLVRNGIDVNSLKPLIKSSNNSVFTIGTVGRMSNQKNPRFFNSIAEKFPDIKFIWIGDGELKSELRSKNIEITGWIKHEEVLNLVTSLDIYVQTSSWEGLPFTIIEAMALQKPIVATNVIGNKDAVKHNYNGFLCDTLADFEFSIKKIIENDSLKETFGNASLIRARELFDKNKNFSDLELIYSKKY